MVEDEADATALERARERRQRFGGARERLLQGRPHYYLWGITVDPARQRTGAGTTLLNAMFDKADGESMPIYLETHQFINVAYYEQRGFQLIHTGTMPGDDLAFWCMLREPNAAKQ